MRSPACLFERIPIMFFIFSFLSVSKQCKRKKALITEPKSVWDCLGDKAYCDIKRHHTNKTLSTWLVLVWLSLFVNSKRGQNEKKVFS